jgi:hypothetical protein
MALSDYQIALNNYNAVMNADPVQRALNDEHRAWGDIMYDEDMRNNATRPRETMDQFTARITVTPTPPTGGEPQTFRRWNAEQPQRQSRFDQRPPRPDQHTRPPLPQRKQQAPAPPPKQQKRPRNSFSALSEEDSE